MPQLFNGDLAGAAWSPGLMVRGRYCIEKALAEGGMGEVFLALDTLLSRRVALKRLHPTGEDHANLRAAILREARRASQINDQHVAAIYDVLDREDEVILVMEFVDGMTLRQRMKEPVPLDAFWDLAHQCLEGVAAAHAQGVIHRDIKPENLMLTRDGLVKILDFGIARRAQDAGGMTSTFNDPMSGMIAGTPQYMAPEAHLGSVVDERTDIFSLGAVFYELLTATRPFEGPTYAAVLHRVMNTDPPPVSVLNPAAGTGLSQLVTRMIAKDPAERIATADELMHQLERVRRETGYPPGHPKGPESAAATLPAVHASRARSAWKYPMFAMLAVAAAVTIGLLWKASTTAALPGERNLAILAPRTPQGGDFARFALGSISYLNERIQKHVDTPGFQMASFSEGLEEKVQTATDARKILGVNLVLVATLEQGADMLKARLDLRDAVHDRPIASRRIEVPAVEPFVFLDRIYRSTAEMLQLNPHAADASSESGIRGAGTLRFYLQGIGRLHTAQTVDDMHLAASEFEAACRMEPQAAVARATWASAQHQAYLRTGGREGLNQATALAREAVRNAPGRSEPHRVLAQVLATDRQHEDALAEFALAARLDPTDDDGWRRLGRAYARLGQPAREKGIYLAAIERRPHCWQPYWWLATWYFRQGNIDESVRTYQEMIRRAPDLDKGYSSLGGVLVLRGEYAQAIDTLKHALELRPTKFAFDNLGTAYFNTGRFQEAVNAYNQSFQFGVAGYDSWLNLGDAYYWMPDRKDEATGAYAQAVRLGREEMLARSKGGRSWDVMIPANLATVFAKLGQPDSARIYITRALSADSANPMVGYCAALTYWQLHDRNRAIAWLEKSVHGGYPTAWLRDSPIFHEWRATPKFRALVSDATEKPSRAASRN